MTAVEMAWVITGMCGQMCFFSRLLSQWIVSERKRESVVPVSFWYFSLAGGLLLLSYAIYRHDPVFILGQSTGVFVYVRNLMLIRRKVTPFTQNRTDGKDHIVALRDHRPPVAPAIQNPQLPAADLGGTAQLPQTCDISLVCPAYNEAESLEQLVAEWDGVLSATGKTYEMIIVDDGSDDGSPQILEKSLKRYTGLRVIRLRRRSGQSAALSAGFDVARGQLIITSDADLQNDPGGLPPMLDLAERFDLVCGWRKDRRDSWLKKLISHAANRRRGKRLDDGVHDTGCGLKVFHRTVLEHIIRFDGMHRFFPALAKVEGFTVTELPVPHRPRVRGKSKYGIFNRLRKPIQDLNAVAWYRTRRLQYEYDELTPPRLDDKLAA